MQFGKSKIEFLLKGYLKKKICVGHSLHKIGNFPTRLIRRPITAKPPAYNISKTIPCSSVANSSFVMQTYQPNENQAFESFHFENTHACVKLTSSLVPLKSISVMLPVFILIISHIIIRWSVLKVCNLDAIEFKMWAKNM